MRSQLRGTVPSLWIHGPVHDEELGLIYEEGIELESIDFSGYEESEPATYVDPPEYDLQVRLELEPERLAEKIAVQLAEFDDCRLTGVDLTAWVEEIELRIEEHVVDRPGEYVVEVDDV